MEKSYQPLLLRPQRASRTFLKVLTITHLVYYEQGSRFLCYLGPAPLVDLESALDRLARCQGVYGAAAKFLASPVRTSKEILYLTASLSAES